MGNKLEQELRSTYKKGKGDTRGYTHYTVIDALVPSMMEKELAKS